MTSPEVLIADIGGTNARFALRTDDEPYFKEVQTLKCADFPHLFDAIDRYIEMTQPSSISHFCFAVAGPVQEQRIDFLNNHWSASAAELKARYKLKRAVLLNDFVAIAYSLPALGGDDLMQVGECAKPLAHKDFSYCVIGPGSGLGIAGLRAKAGLLYAIDTEGGHTGFAPLNQRQRDVLAVLQQRYHRVSNERLVSGPGLENLYLALNQIEGFKGKPKTAQEIANDDKDPLCQEAVSLFLEVLGQVAGDAALALGAFDGVFIGGGITPRFPHRLQNSKFRQGFADKGRYCETMQDVPTWLIKHPNAGLLGASVFAKQECS
jgi:glucokinase